MPHLIDKTELSEEIRNFRQFAFKKNMIELSIAFVLGGAFNKVIAAISQNLIMPIIGAIGNWMTAKTGADWRDFTLEPFAGMKFEIGAFGAALFDFILTAIVLYLIFQKMVRPIWQRVIDQQEEEDKKPTAVPICWRQKED